MRAKSPSRNFDDDRRDDEAQEAEAGVVLWVGLEELGEAAMGALSEGRVARAVAARWRYLGKNLDRIGFECAGRRWTLGWTHMGTVLTDNMRSFPGVDNIPRRFRTGYGTNGRCSAVSTSVSQPF